MQKKNKGFTLIEMLVVVLIIGILAGIALPQYQMAVTKAKVASILPLMRRWKDALIEYKLQHGDYGNETDGYPDGATLGVNWPSDWSDGECGDSRECINDYWYCQANLEGPGLVRCGHSIDGDNYFAIQMVQDDDFISEDFQGMMMCNADGDEAHKICKALGGKLIDGYDYAYKLN